MTFAWIIARHWLAVLLGALLASAPAAAQESEMDVDLELVLAVDISLSMDTEEQRLQRDGYVQAIRHPDVVAAIRGGLLGRIAVTYVEWAGSPSQEVLIPWTLIDGEAAAEAFANRLAAIPLRRTYRTSISGALQFSGPLFERNGFRGLRRVIDVSGDGPNNQGVPVVPVRDALVKQGIVINGLAIMINVLNYDGFFDILNLDQYYEDCVIGGTGAFIVPVTETAQFAPAIRRKMILEIAAPEAPLVRVAAQTAREPVDCLIGEKQWERWMEMRE
jgi:hypothetical protein